MSGAMYVILPPTSIDLVSSVLEAGAIPVIDATGSHAPEVPDGAWVRTRPGRPAPGSGPVILAELGAPVPDRPTWLESAAAREIPKGFAGLVLKGREAGGLAGEADGLTMLAQCREPQRIILDAGLGPHTASAAAALGAAGIMLVEQHLACPELRLPPGLRRQLDLADDEVTHLVAGVRVANPVTAPVLRRLVAGESPWTLSDGIWADGDLHNQLWLAGQGLALARELASRYSSLSALIAAYQHRWNDWPAQARQATSTPASHAATGQRCRSQRHRRLGGSLAGSRLAATPSPRRADLRGNRYRRRNRRCTRGSRQGETPSPGRSP